MSTLKAWLVRPRGSVLTVLAMAVAIVIGAFAFTEYPQQLGLVSTPVDESDPHAGHDHGPGEHDDHGEDDHAGHDHEGHEAGQSIELSQQARANLRLK
ncbi:MAG: efflux RND transporter periplasmic adaptor subunit, partial [Planctomycetota bacterium]